MSELDNNLKRRKYLLKHMILQLHEGVAPSEVKKQLAKLLGQIPYEEVVAVEQELIEEGLPQEEVLRLCDVHSEVLKGSIDQTGTKESAPGHPVHTFKEENRAIAWEVESVEKIYENALNLKTDSEAEESYSKLRTHFMNLTDVEKHYSRKENLLFPFLEKDGITGPPSVMWGKHDEIRGMLKKALKTLEEKKSLTVNVNVLADLIEKIFRPCSTAIKEMIYKEEQILFPMCLDKLTESEWYDIYNQSLEIGFCLYDPVTEWKPAGTAKEKIKDSDVEKVQFPSGSMTVEELNTVLNTIPFDMTFVDKEDKVRYFTQGKERIFSRTRAILGRTVQRCHPPASVHIVQKILEDFKSGKQDRAAFWLTMDKKFIHIEYFALRDTNGNYLGTLEVSQDLTGKRALEGERRLLKYEKG